VLAYLKAENKYKDAVLKDTQPLQVGARWGGGVGLGDDTWEGQEGRAWRLSDLV
jgi:hypothetical protein